MKPNKIFQVFCLALFASAVFYCGQTYKRGDALAESDAGDECVVCPEPPKPQPFFRYRTVEVITTVDASAHIPLPHWGEPGTMVQSWTRVFVVNGSHWVPDNGGACRPTLFTEAPDYAPDLPVPSLYFHPGTLRECRIVIIEPTETDE